MPGTAVNLSGGTLTAGAYNLNGNPSRLHWTGGQLYISGDITFDPAANPTTTSAAFGSSLTLGPSQTMVVSGNQTLGGGGTFSLTMDGGTDYLSNVGAVLAVPSKGTLTINPGSFIRYDTLVQSGGTINGTLTNQATFTYQGGLFNGRLVNRGTINLGGRKRDSHDIPGTVALGDATPQVSRILLRRRDNLLSDFTTDTYRKND